MGGRVNVFYPEVRGMTRPGGPTAGEEEEVHHSKEEWGGEPGGFGFLTY